MSARIVFMGSPIFSLPTLRLLAQHHPVVGIVTQPDRPAGRGRKLTPPAIKLLAAELDIETIQPARLKEPSVFEKLQSWQPDLIVVAAFGQILRQNVLDLPTHGCLNVHASLLPRWRGAAPIQAAILHGDAHSGVTIMKMERGVDSGAILSQRREPILPHDTAATLSQRLAQIGAELLIETLPDYLADKITPQPQDDSLATYAPMLKKEDGKLDLTQPAAELERRVRAFNPHPGAFVIWQEGATLKLHCCRVESGAAATPGLTAILDDQPALATGNGWLVLQKVQSAGKKVMSGIDFLRGERKWGAPAICK